MHPSIDGYLVTLERKGRSPLTLKATRQDLARFVTWWEATRHRRFDPALLLDRDVRAWRIARQRDDGAAPATINRGLSALRGYCAWATAAGVLTENPTADVADVTLPPLAPRSLPPDAVDALLRMARGGLGHMKDNLCGKKFFCQSHKDKVRESTIVGELMVLRLYPR